MLPVAVEEIIEAAIDDYWLKPERPPLAALVREVELRCARSSIAAPTYKAVRARVQARTLRQELRRREGQTSARVKTGRVAGHLSVDSPMALVQIDHTLADVIVVAENNRLPIGRPWLTLAIDIATRMVAGFYLSLDPPSVLSVDGSQPCGAAQGSVLAIAVNRAGLAGVWYPGTCTPRQRQGVSLPRADTRRAVWHRDRLPAAGTTALGAVHLLPGVGEVTRIHALLVGGERQQRVFLNVIRLLANDPQIPLVCAGTPEARRALLTDGGLADRFESVELPRWSNNLAFRRLLASFAAALPLRRPSDLDQEKVRTRILKLTDGVTVRVARLLERLAIEAIRSKTECIRLESFEMLPTRAPLLSMEGRRAELVS